jgi:hypothetical protein
MAEGPAGRERRLAHRVPVQQSVRLLDGWRPKQAALLGLSLTGCRLVAEADVIARGRVRLFLPAARRFGLPLRGEVAWSQPLEGEDAGLCQVGIHFTRMPGRPRRRLERALAGWLQEPEPEHEPQPEHETAADSERRRARRHGYELRVIAHGGGRPRVLLARDLSTGGMRVAGGGDLALDEVFSVALHVGDGSVPLVLAARVVRHHAGGEAALHFEGLDASQAEHLAKMLATLPPLRSGEGEALYVSEILPKDRDPGELR